MYVHVCIIYHLFDATLILLYVHVHVLLMPPIGIHVHACLCTVYVHLLYLQVHCRCYFLQYIDCVHLLLFSLLDIFRNSILFSFLQQPLVSFGGEGHKLGGIRDSSQQVVAIEPQVLSRHVSDNGKHLDVLTNCKSFLVYSALAAAEKRAKMIKEMPDSNKGTFTT